MQRWLQQHPQHLAAVQAAVSSPGVSWFLWSFAAAFTAKVAKAVGYKAAADGSQAWVHSLQLLVQVVHIDVCCISGAGQSQAQQCQRSLHHELRLTKTGTNDE